MALAFSKIAQYSDGPYTKAVYDVTFDSSYPTGGEAFTAANFGLNNVVYGTADVKSVGGTVNVANVYVDRANLKLKVYDETPAEAANTSDLSTLVVQVQVVGW